MAHFVQGIALAALFAVGGIAANFPHALHLSLDLTCTSCHASAGTSTRVEDNLLPKPAVCLRCHGSGDVAIPAPPRTNLIHFSHALHLKMGNVAPVISAAIDKGVYLSPPGEVRRFLDTKNPCGACHRGVDTSVKVSNTLMPHMADCLVCHNQIDPPDSCATCHATDAKLKPGSHTDDFLDSHTSKPLDKPTCAVCHGRTFHCMGCHIETK